MTARIFLGAVFVLFLGAPANAASEIDRAVWVGNASYQISRGRNWEYVDYLDRTVSISAGGPSSQVWVHEADALKHRTFIDSLDQSGLPRTGVQHSEFLDPEASRANKIYEALKQAGPPGFLVGDWLQSQLRTAIEPREMLLLSQQNRAASNSFRTNARRLTEVLGAVYDLAQKDKTYGEFIDVVFGRRFGANTNDAADTILANNPDYANNRYVRQLVKSGGSAQDRAVRLVEAVKRDLQAKIDGMGSEVSRIAGNLRREEDISVKASSKSEEAFKKIILSAEAQNRAAIVRAEVEDLRAAGFVVSAFLSDRDLARGINATTQAVGQFYTSVNDFEQNQLLLKARHGENLATAMSAAALTYNFLSIGLLLSQAFGPHQDSPDAIILSAIKELSKQLAEFQKEVRARFDHIDWELNEIYSLMVRDFASLAESIGRVRYDVEAAQRAIDRIALRLDAFQRNTLARLDLAIDQRFHAEMEKCLGYEQRTGRRLTQERYSDCVAEIISYLKEARDPTRSDYWDASLDTPQSLAERLKDEDWPAHVNLFRGMARARAGFEFGGIRANPTRWALASAAFVDLSAENIDYFRASPLVEFDALNSEGEALSREFGWEISFKQPARILNLYRDLIVRYNESLKRTQAAAAEVRKNAISALGSQLADASPSLETASPEVKVLASTIAKREIRHAARTSEDLIAINKKPWPSVGPQTPRGPVVGDERWPNVFNPEKVWAAILQNDDLLKWEMLGLGKLELTYIAYYSNVATGEYQIYAAPTIGYWLQAKDKASGTVTKLASATVGQKSRVWLGWNGGGSHLIQNTAFDFSNYLKETELPFGLPQFSLDLDAKTIEQQVSAASEIMATRVREELISKLKSSTSDLSQALFELDGCVRALRGLTVLAFPRSVAVNDDLRAILFGQDDAGSQEQIAPLLTSKNAFNLVLWPDLQKARQGAQNAPKGGGPEQWPPSVFLRDLDARTENSERVLLEVIESIVTDKSAGPQSQAVVSEGLRRLETLKNLRSLQ